MIRFARGDRGPGVTLTVATIAALVWVNVWPGSYEQVWAHIPRLGSALGLHFSLQDWTNQGLMTVFFAAVGLEIRREMSAGELASWHRAATPVAAAGVGMLVPAGLYALVVHGGPGAHGWGIPMATDVAFALGALALVAAHASPRLRVFLMTLAVADDLGSIALLVFFYSTGVAAGPISIGLVCIAAMVVIEARRPEWWVVKAALGALAWWGFARGGIEAAVVGVVIGAVARRPRSWERRLQPWLTLVVLPVFALANAGVSLRHFSFAPAGAAAVFVAVLVARVAGKPIGIGAGALAMRRAFRSRSDAHLAVVDVAGVGALASVGFTVPLLIIRAAFAEGPLADSATLALLVGTLIGAALGGVILLAARRRPR